MFVSSLPYFPLLVVEAKQVLAGRKKTRDVLLCVSKEAVLILDDKTNQITEQLSEFSPTFFLSCFDGLVCRFSFSRLVSWAFSKELFTIRSVAERGASRKGAEEQVFITPEVRNQRIRFIR
jgi:predicted methyltransferase